MIIIINIIITTLGEITLKNYRLERCSGGFLENLRKIRHITPFHPPQQLRIIM